MLHRAAVKGTAVQVRLELDEGTPVARVCSAGSGPAGVKDGWGS
jgi:hypothetical protein